MNIDHYADAARLEHQELAKLADLTRYLPAATPRESLRIRLRRFFTRSNRTLRNAG